MSPLKIFYIAALSFFGSTARAADGNMTSGGGDSRAVEFTAIGYEVAGYLRDLKASANPTSQMIEVDDRLFLQTVEGTKVFTEDTLMLNGHEVDAINHPLQSYIELNRSRWDSFGPRNDLKLTLVFHEYLGVMGLDDSRYQISHVLLEQFSQRGIRSASEIHCRAFVTQAWRPDPKVTDEFEVHISQRGAYNAMVSYRLKGATSESNQEITGTYLVERFTRELPPSVREILSARSPDERFRIDVNINIPNGQESHSSYATLSDYQNGARVYLNYNLHCKVLASAQAP